MVSLSYLFKVSLSSAFLDIQFIELNFKSMKNAIIFSRDNPDKANQEESPHYTTMAGNFLLL